MTQPAKRLTYKPLTYEQRERYACKICGNVPDEDGALEHGRGCYRLSEDGGGIEYVEMELGEWQELTGFSCPSACQAELTKLREHISHCPDCGVYWGQLEELRKEVDRLLGADRTVVEIEMDFDVCKKNLAATRETTARWQARAYELQAAVERLRQRVEAAESAASEDNLRLAERVQRLEAELASTNQRAEALQQQLSGLVQAVTEDTDELCSVLETIKGFRDGLNPVVPQAKPQYVAWAKAVMPPLEAALAAAGKEQP